MFKNYYQVKVHVLSKYIGKNPTEQFPQNEIKDETYDFHYATYKEALDEYKKNCVEGVGRTYLPVVFATSQTVALIDVENEKGKRKILYQFTCSSI